MKKTIVAPLIAAAFILSLPLSAQTTNAVSTVTLTPPQTKAGYYVKDGETHNVFILKQEEEDYVTRLVVPIQDGYPEAVLLFPDQVSEWGFKDGKSCWLGARVETAEGDKWYFMEDIGVRTSDGSRIATLSGKILPVETYFRVVNGEATRLGTEHDAGSMLDYYSETTGYRSTDAHLKYPRNVNSAERYYRAFAERNDKLFPQRRFGIMVGGGVNIPYYHTPHFSKVTLRPGRSLSAGVFLSIPIEGEISIQPELLYSVDSGSTREEGRVVYSYLGTENFIIDYVKDAQLFTKSVKLPLMFRYTHIGSKSNLIPYFEAGPVVRYYFGKLLSNTSETINGNPSVGERKWQISSYSYGFGVGAGMEYYINSRQAAWLGVRGSFYHNIHKRGSIIYSSAVMELVAAFSLFNF
jgi:hypothetical protein